MLQLNRDKRACKITEAEYNQKGCEIGAKIDKLLEEQKSLQAKTDENRLAKYRLKKIIDILNKVNVTEKFDGDIFKSIVDKIMVDEKDKMFIKFTI